jgi:hypothetical protein
MLAGARNNNPFLAHNAHYIEAISKDFYIATVAPSPSPNVKGFDKMIKCNDCKKDFLTWLKEQDFTCDRLD